MQRDYLDPRYKTWRKTVRKRDKGCMWPGCKAKKKLQTHHILPWSTNPSLRFVVGNGITLCKKHHDAIRGKEHTYVRLFSTLIS